jgi:hypothetical protein
MVLKIEREELAVDEAFERYADQWIFMQVTELDQYGAPSRGLIISHHPKRGIIQRHIMKAIGERRGDEQYYLFFGERRFTWKEWKDWSEAKDAKTHKGS